MRFIFAILFSTFPLQSAWGNEIVLRIGIHKIHASIADTPDSRERGLMKIRQLCENCGMLFVFPRAGKYSFWMQSTPLPLSIAFIAADGNILNIAEMEANSTRIHRAQDDILYALEMNQGWFTEHAIKPQQQIEGLQLTAPGK
jgi:uncharacterized protein